MTIGFANRLAKEGPRLTTRAAQFSFLIFLVADIAWLASSKIRVPASNLIPILQLVAIFAALYLVPAAILGRLSDDKSPLGSSIRRWSRALTCFLQASFFITAASAAGVLFTVLAASLGWPLQDEALARADSLIGFYWLDTLATLNAWKLGYALKAAYHSAAPQIFLLFVLLSVTQREQQLSEFLTLYSICLLATAVISALVPAAGAYAHFQPPPGLHDTFSALAGMWHYELLVSLRNDPAPVLNLNRMEGLVTFPSFHTVLAIITAYAARGIRFVAVPAALLNAVVILSTLPEGGHYLVDVIAGALIAIIAIVILRWHASGVRGGLPSELCSSKAVTPTSVRPGAN